MVRSVAKIFLVVTILLTVVPSTQAAAVRAEGAPAARSEALALMSWGFLADLWEWVATAWEDNGCWVDPNGDCSAVWSDNGCILDPSGGCRG